MAAYAYTANYTASTVTKINLSTFLTVGSALTVGTGPFDIAIDPTGTYATVAGASAQVSVALGTYGTANVAGALDIEIPCYALTTFQKAFTSRSGYYDAVAAPTNYSEGLYRGLWRSTAAITSLALAPTTGPNFTIGSAFYLYGIN